MNRTLSWLSDAHAPDPIEDALTDADVAVAMVAFGVGVSVRLCNQPVQSTPR